MSEQYNYNTYREKDGTYTVVDQNECVVARGFKSRTTAREFIAKKMVEYKNGKRR